MNIISDLPEFKEVSKLTKDLCSKIDDEETRENIKELVCSICMLIVKERDITRVRINETFFDYIDSTYSWIEDRERIMEKEYKRKGKYLDD